MRAGSLDRTITIQSVATSVNDAGTPSEIWTSFAVVRAALIQASTEEYQRAYGEGGNTSIIFRTRYLADVTTDHRVTYEGKVLNIREVKELGRRRGLEIRCEEIRS